MNKRKKGQVAIEMTAALIAVFIFLLGTLQIFLWLNRLFIERQSYYESTRTSATDGQKGAYTWSPTPLDIFGGGKK